MLSQASTLISRRGTWLAGGVGILIGLTWLVLWFMGFGGQWSAGGVLTMKTNMALCQVLSGVALVWLAAPELTRRKRLFGAVFATVVLLAGGLTLGEHLFAWDLGIDQLLASEAPGAVGAVAPNRIGVPGSLSLLLVGVGLVARFARVPGVAPVAGLVTCVVNLIPAVGFLYGIHDFYTLPRFTGTSWSSVVGLLTLGTGLLLASPGHPTVSLLLRLDPGGTVLRRFLPAIVILPLALGFVSLQAARLHLFDSTTATGVLAISLVVVFGYLIWRLAATLSRVAAVQAETHHSLQRSEQRYRSLVQISPKAIFINRENRILFANPAAVKLFGAARESDLLGKSPYDVFHPNCHAVMRQRIEAVSQGGTVPLIEEQIVRLDGTVADVEVVAARFEDADGPALQVVLRDISERKHRDELGAAQNRISQLIHSTLAIDSVLQRVLREAAGALGSDTAAMSLRSGTEWIVNCVYGLPADLVGIRTGDQEEQHAVLALETRRPVAIGDAFNDKRTSREHMMKWNIRSVMAIPLLSRAEPFGVLFLNYHKGVHHFTQAEEDFAVQLAASLSLALENARLYENLREHAASLEFAVAARTSRLREMVGDLEHLSYTLAHDLRAPLRSVRGFTDLLMQECADCIHASRLDFLSRITISCKRLDDLIRDTLQYSRAMRDETPLRPVDMGRLLAAMPATYPNLHPDEADIEIQGRLPLVLANETALTQCFANLLGNAVKFVSPGTKPRVKIYAGIVDRQTASGPGHPPKNLVRVWVEDNGIGIPREHQGRLFQMFHRLSSNYEGTGVGLALVRKVVERMGGRVGVESVPGQGSRFWIELESGEGGLVAPGQGVAGR